MGELVKHHTDPTYKSGKTTVTVTEKVKDILKGGKDEPKPDKKD